MASGMDLGDVIANLKASGCHPFDIGRFFRSAGIANETFHQAARGVLADDLADAFRGLIWERCPAPYPRLVPSFDGHDREKIESKDPASHVLARQAWDAANERNDPAQLFVFGSDPVWVDASHGAPPRLDTINSKNMLHLHHRLISWGKWWQDDYGNWYWIEFEPPPR